MPLNNIHVWLRVHVKFYEYYFFKGGERLLSKSWIHFIDSGGQPEFHDLLPLFIQNTAVVIFVLKLSESLHDKPRVEYFDSSGRIGDPCESYLTNKEILEHTINTFERSSSQGVKLIIIGTHKDHQQKLEIEDLKKCLEHNKSVVIFGREPIALINCLAEHDPQREGVIKNIKESIKDAANNIENQKIPLAWLVLKTELKKASMSKDGILNLDECKMIASKISLFKANRDQFGEALQHLADQNIFLYYPEILPDVVFCDPQVLLTGVTSIVQCHYTLKNSKNPVSGDMIQFVNNGYISISILTYINKNTKFMKPEFLLKLLSGLNIISAIDTNYYLMPALLPYEENPALRVEDIPGKESIPALCITFSGGCAPTGLFSSLINRLLQSSHWKLRKKAGTPVCCFRNSVAFVYDLESIVTLMNYFSHFRVVVQTPYKNTCKKIIEEILQSINAWRKVRLHPTRAIDCPFHEDQSHVAFWHSNPKECCECSIDNTKSGPLPGKYQIWKNGKFFLLHTLSIHVYTYIT